MEELGGAMDQGIAELARKIDCLTAQVQYLAEQAQIAERARQERAELLNDFKPIANQAMLLATTHLQEVDEYVRPEDWLRLLKKLVKARPHLEALLDQFSSAMELVEIAGPLGKESFATVEQVLDGMDRKGYFLFAKGGMQILDNIVTSFTEEDVRQLGDNIVLILRTVKEMTQPEVMNLLHNTVQVIDPEQTGKVETSIPSLLGQMRDPSVRRGLALTMRMLKNLGSQAPGDGNGAGQKPGMH
jgi:uncharacterized protein YjgD (DUF1641 family)